MGFNFKKYDKADVDLDKEIDVDIDVDIDIDYDVEVDEDVDVNADFDVHTHVQGNSAEAVVDVEAIGTDTYTSMDIAVLTLEGEMSSISGSFTSVVG
ncbi:hypothetical protein [Alloyangia pacifica]|uniref:Uncharacterized protein n=1 Tax=Alloyangia pacifica TaxID=311180 RepID=A0A1I6VMG6_9RHOB|nr:hypothetical protein [Alloyangia pacifica]SDI05851.1 hypothetical protein SAMN04488245_11218 [Alloyangia pacifica]SFT14900.1 hypothetical protein SAMN04488050_11218 [Alloyangia pacifica]